MGLLTKQSMRGLMARRGGALAIVGALHLFAVTGLLQMQYVHRPQPVAAAIRVTNFHLQPPPVAPAPAVVSVVLDEAPPIEVVVPVVQITTPEAPPPTAITPPPQSSPPVAQAPPPVVQDAGPVTLDFSEVDMVKSPPPVYPRAAKLAGVQGTVLVWALVDTEGRPQQVRVHRSSGFEQLDRAGCDGVRAWLFQPHKPNGVATNVHVIIPVTFEIGRRMVRNDRDHDASRRYAEGNH